MGLRGEDARPASGVEPRRSGTTRLSDRREKTRSFGLESGDHGEQIETETSARINSLGLVNRTDQQTSRARELRVDWRLDFIRCVLRLARPSVEGRRR